MQVKCQCGKVLTVPDSYAGKKARCPACRNVFTVDGKSTLGNGDALPKDRVVSTPDFNNLFEDGAPSKAAPKPSKPARKSSVKPTADSPKPSEETFTLAQQKCSHCGSPLPPGAQLCVECGTNLGTGAKIATVDVGELKAKKSEKKRQLFIIAAAVAAAVIVVGVTLFIFLK